MKQILALLIVLFAFVVPTFAQEDKEYFVAPNPQLCNQWLDSLPAYTVMGRLYIHGQEVNTGIWSADCVAMDAANRLAAVTLINLETYETEVQIFRIGTNGKASHILLEGLYDPQFDSIDDGNTFMVARTAFGSLVIYFVENYSFEAEIQVYPGNIITSYRLSPNGFYVAITEYSPLLGTYQVKVFHSFNESMQWFTEPIEEPMSIVDWYKDTMTVTVGERECLINTQSDKPSLECPENSLDHPAS